MTALRNACSATDTLLDVDVALGINQYPTAYTIDSEVVNVVGGGSALTLTVQRGIGGTTKAAHTVGATLTAANAFSGGGSDVPDPSGAPDGQVIQTLDDEFVLEGGGEVTVRLEEVVVAFDDDVATGVPVASLAASEQMIWAAMYLDSALTETGAGVKLMVGADEYSASLGLNTAISASFGGLFVLVAALRATGAVDVEVKLTEGTWTGGAVRIAVLIATPTV